MSPSDQPLKFRLTLSREEAVSFLQSLAYEGDLRAEFEQDPRGVLSRYGIEVTPAEAMPKSVVVPSPEEIESAIESLGPPAVEHWNAQLQWAYFPFIGLLAKPMEGGELETD